MKHGMQRHTLAKGQRRAFLTSQLQRVKRRYPFTESTRLIELVDKKHYGDVVKLTVRLKPYLKDEGKGAFLLTGLFFDLEAVSGQRQFVIDELAVFLKKHRLRPEQVQDFYPTPGTVSTCMFYTGLDPNTMEPVYVPRTPEEKAKQRALLQYFKPENRKTVLEALRQAGRTDLIGNTPNCLIAGEPAAQKTAKDKKRKKTIRNIHKPKRK